MLCRRKIIIIVIGIIIRSLLLELLVWVAFQLGGSSEYESLQLMVFMCLFKTTKIRQFENRTC